MPEPRETLERVLEAHRPYGLDCKCGVAINSDAWWATHVATVVLAASAWPAVGVRPAAPEPVVDAPQDAPKPQTHAPARERSKPVSWATVAQNKARAKVRKEREQ